MDWDRKKYVHVDGIDELPEESRDEFEAELVSDTTACENCGFYFLNDDLDINDFYVSCTNPGCESRRELRREVEPLTWSELYNWVYGIIQD